MYSERRKFQHARPSAFYTLRGAIVLLLALMIVLMM